MQTLTQIKQLLEAHGMRPKRSLGQNFLTDHNLIRKLADAARLEAGETVLEVGPGTGTLTEELLERGCRVVACELDDGLAGLLRERVPALLGSQEAHRFTLIHADCLEDKRTISAEVLRAVGDGPFKLVANLPYGAATPLIAALLSGFPACGLMAVTIQRELGDRLAALPGTRDYGPLAVLTALSARVSRIAFAPAECFWPRPDVTSVMMLLERRPDAADSEMLNRVSVFAQRVFAQRRKQLGAAMGKSTDWESIGRAEGCAEIWPQMRAEQLRPEQIAALAAAVGG